MADLTRAATLWRSGKRLEAEREVAEVLRVSPDEPAALRSLAEIHAASGRGAEAIAVWRRLCALLPTDAGSLRQLAQALLAERDFGGAITALRAAIRLEPANARAYNNLGLAQLRSGDAQGAAASLERATALDASYALAHLNLGMARRTAGDTAAARDSYQRALQLDPHLSQARVHLSELLRETDAAAARLEHDRAVESHAINLMTVRRHDEAIPLWTQLIDSGARIGYLEGMRFHCKLHSCDWSDYRETAARLEMAVADGQRADLPFSFFVHSNSPAAQLQCSRIFVADRFPGVAGGMPSVPQPGSQRIRVAYVSFDYHEHATAYLVAGLFEAHDRSRYEIFALSYGQPDGSAMRARLEASVEHFIDVSRKSDAEVAALMQSLGVQIAVDLKGFTGGARTGIFAQRAAPLQINFLGYPGTLGAPYIDYIVADHRLIPAADRPHYAEQVIYMPQCYQPNDARRPRPVSAPARLEFGLPERGFVFCCFNNLYKITPPIFDCWMSLLQGVPGAVLWLLEGTAAAMRNLRGTCADHGIAPDRILFAPHIPLAEHLTRYRHADLFLDTSPCNAHTTASDALWMGVPVLTLTGRTFAGRVATSLLHAVGMPELCTRTLDEYRAAALRLATTPEELSALKRHLEEGREDFALFDSPTYCRHLERAYEQIWARRARGEPATTLEMDGSAAVG